MSIFDPRILSCTDNVQTGLFLRKNGDFGRPQKKVEEFLPPDFGLARCWKSALKGSVLGFPGLESSLLMSLSGDFVEFLQRSSDIVPDRTNGITFRHTSDPYPLGSWARWMVPLSVNEREQGLKLVCDNLPRPGMLLTKPYT